MDEENNQITIMAKESIDKDESTESTNDLSKNCLKRHFQEWCALFNWDGNKEAKALSMVHIAGGADAIATSIYLFSAIIELANEAANCPKRTSNNEFPECENRVYGIKPSSLLSVYLVVLGLTSSIFMPLVGALVDSTGYRRAIGRITIAISCIALALRFLISSETWFFISLLQFFIDFISAVNRLMYYAYISELTKDSFLLAKYNASISICFNLSVLLFLVVMTGAARVLGISDDSVKTAQVAMILVFVLYTIFNGYSWAHLFGPRQKKIYEANLKSSLSKSTHRLLNTVKVVLRGRSDLKWILLSRSFANAAALATLAATLTYTKNDLGFSSSEIGIALLFTLAFAIPGNKLSVTISKRFNPLNSLRLCYLLCTVLSLLFPLIVISGEHKNRIYMMMMLWGVVIGWKEPTDKTLFSELITKSHEAEMMGLYIFASQILIWLPPSTFTVMNEAGIDIRISIACIAGYFSLALMFLICVGDFESALTQKIIEEEKEAAEGVNDLQASVDKVAV